MRRTWYGILAALALSACSGSNPFVEDSDAGSVTDPATGTDNRVAAVAGDLDAAEFTPDPSNPTLIVTGVAFNGTPLPVAYDRKSALDTPGGQYQAFTRQPDALNTHATAYARDIDGTQGILVVTGGMGGYYNGGVTYSRTGAYVRPADNAQNADVRYDGEYVGLLNHGDNGADLLPVPAETDPTVAPRQAGRVYGQARINADFSTNQVKGTVYDRTYVATGTELPALAMAPTAISQDGTFSGEVTTLDHQNKGEYSGTFGGPEAGAVAGGLFAKDHIDDRDQIEEYGVFVLERSN